MLSNFRFAGKAAQALLMTRLQYTQMIEVNGLIKEMAGEDGVASLDTLEDSHTTTLVEQVREALRLSVLLSDLTPEAVKYFEDESNSAFPAEDGDLHNVTLGEYFDEIAEDLVSLLSIPTPDIVNECEDTVGNIVSFLEPLDKE